jgi:hypothetical protein
VPDLRDATVRRLAFRAAVFALLIGNTAYYVLQGTSSQALDSLAWLTLLALFELEAWNTGRAGQRHMGRVIRVLRIAAAGALVAALVGYVREREWLDAINVGLWIAVVGVFELELRRPDVVAHPPGKYMAPILYTGLGILVIAWLLRGEWFDAYDAALWLTAFATLELDLLDRFGSARNGT